MKKIVKNPVVDEISKKMEKMSVDELNILIPDLLYIKANFLFNEKKYGDVVRVANEALKKDPEAMGFLALKFRASKKLKKINLAKRILITMTKIDRDVDVIDSRFEWPSIRKIFYEEALPFLEPIIKRNLKNPVPIETKGRIFGLLGKFDDMYILCDWIYKIEPRNHTAPIFKEYLLYIEGKRTNPIEDIDMIIKKTGTKNKKVLAFRDKTVQEIMEMESLKRIDGDYASAKKYVIETGKASTSSLQTAFRWGYNKAARILIKLEEEGVIDKAKQGRLYRKILIKNPGLTPQGIIRE